MEGRIVCADTLANVANPDWTFETALGLTVANQKIREALRERWGVVQMWADAFHVNKYEMASVALPDKWLDDALTNREARRLGRALIDAVNPSNVQRNRSGTRGGTFENVNFHETCPELIEEIDYLYLDALGLLDDRLLNQLYKLRSNSNWRFD